MYSVRLCSVLVATMGDLDFVLKSSCYNFLFLCRSRCQTRYLFFLHQLRFTMEQYDSVYKLHLITLSITNVMKPWLAIVGNSTWLAILNGKWGMLPEGGFLMTRMACHGIMGQYWGGLPLTSSGCWSGVSVNLSYLFTYHPPRIWLLLTRRERWIFDSCGVIFTLIIHWSGPLLLLPWFFEPTLAIWSDRLAKNPYQKHTPPAVRLEPAILIMQVEVFLPGELSYMGFEWECEI